ncbi:MAG: CHAD domain-containing protein [Acidimicrobiales bacterium]
MTDDGGSPALEIEWQFDAIDLRPVERWLGRIAGPLAGDGNGSGPSVTSWAQPAKRLHDSYMDTDDWRVGRCGYVLRVRRSAGLGEATLKGTTPPSGDGPRKRVEITELLPPQGMEALSVDGPVGRRVHALAGSRELRRVLDVRTTRRPFDLRNGGESVAEVALDETVIYAGEGQRPARLRRVEVEVNPEWTERLAPMVEDLKRSCGLQSATLSKFEAGLLAAGLEIPGPPDLGPTEVTPDSTIGELAYAVIRRNMVSMLVHEPGTRLGEDSDELHDMRVATRRMRAALSLFKDVLPVRVRSLRDELGWLADKLGTVRDLDVQIERLGAWAQEVPGSERAALTGLAGLLESERAAGRAELLADLESARYERLMAGLCTMLRQGPPRRTAATRAPAVAVVPDLVAARQRSAAKAARPAKHSAQPEDFHRLRIRCKRLRYALEFVSDVYEGATSKVVRRVVRLQDSLGLMQDATVAVARLESLATNPSNGLSATTVFVMGGVAERYRFEAKQIAEDLPKGLKALRGSRWQKLKVLMERRRLELAAFYRWPLQPRSVQPTDLEAPHEEVNTTQS